MKLIPRRYIYIYIERERERERKKSNYWDNIRMSVASGVYSPFRAILQMEIIMIIIMIQISINIYFLCMHNLI